MKILIVEDEFVSRMKMQKILQNFGDTDTAANGEEAFEAFKLSFKERKPYELVMMDIVMPDISGQEVVKKIRSFEEDFRKNINPNYVECKVIMVSALKDAKNILSSFKEFGCDDYIVKPFTKEKVVEALNKLGLID